LADAQRERARGGDVAFAFARTSGYDTDGTRRARAVRFGREEEGVRGTAGDAQAATGE